MKRILAIILSIIIVLSLVACGSEQKAAKYCSNCGESIPKDVAFCEYCGVAINANNSKDEESSTNNDITSTDNFLDKYTETNTSTEDGKNNTPSSKPTTSTTAPNSSTSELSPSTQTTSKPTETSKPSIPTSIHTHSYSKKVIAPTCKNKGYTTYTCSCGNTYKDNYTNPSHSYTEYICLSCGAIDKANAHKHLVEYVKANGKPNGTFVSIIIREVNGKKYELKYDAQNKALWATCWTNSQSSTVATALCLEDGSYVTEYTHLSSGAGSRVMGCIEPKTFNENSAMTYESFTGLESGKNSILNLTRNGLVLTIVEVERYLDTNNVGLNVYALGYMGLQ